MRIETIENDPYRRERRVPETFVERIAWALCAADQTSAGTYLNDDELHGLEALLSKMARTCGNEKAEAQWLDVPPIVVKRSIRALKRLAALERQRREQSDPLFSAHLTAAFWLDYMANAEAAWSVMLQDARVQAAVSPEPPPC